MDVHIIIHKQGGKKLHYTWIFFLPSKIQSNVDSGKPGLEAAWVKHIEQLPWNLRLLTRKQSLLIFLSLLFRHHISCFKNYYTCK